MGTVEESRLNELKLLCVEDETPEAHAAHAAELEEAYRAFQGRSESNPAEVGVVTEVTGDVVVSSEEPVTELPVVS